MRWSDFRQRGFRVKGATDEGAPDATPRGSGVRDEYTGT
jgi:hypothetical protein